MIGGNVVWLLHCHRTKKSNMDWLDGPFGRHWKDLSRRERRRLLAFAAIFLGSFAVFFD
jgi:hypothetical protein